MILYTDIDEDCCEWASNLVDAGLVPKGDVLCADIRNITPKQLHGYAQVHFFCGILGWPLALQLAGWPEDRPVCTASLPCQPFSDAGKRKGFKDERHLFPVFAKLVKECGFRTIVGEQVEAAIRLGWLDSVFTALEGLDYACAAACLPAAGVGAFHIRQRLFWLAQSQRDAGESRRVTVEPGKGDAAQGAGTHAEPRRCSNTGGVGDTSEPGREGHRPESLQGGVQQQPTESVCSLGGVEKSAEQQCKPRSEIGGTCREMPENQREPDNTDRSGFWREAVLIPCADNKLRPACSRIPPLAHGVPRTVAAMLPRLPGMADNPKGISQLMRAARRHRKIAIKGAGNAIVPQVAAEFIRAVMEATE